jgi:hypothetical protein
MTMVLARERIARLERLRTRLREQATGALGARASALATVVGMLADVHRAAGDARAATMRVATGADLGVAWDWADALARRAALLVVERARAVAAVEAMRAELRARRAEEEQLARLAARGHERTERDERRRAAAAADALALWQYGRMR